MPVFGSSGTLKSPEFSTHGVGGGQYPSDYNCDWVIIAGFGSTISITFTAFDVILYFNLPLLFDPLSLLNKFFPSL